MIGVVLHISPVRVDRMILNPNLSKGKAANFGVGISSSEQQVDLSPSKEPSCLIVEDSCWDVYGLIGVF